MSRISRFVLVILLVVVPNSVTGSDDPWQSLAEQAATQGISQESIDSAQAAIRDDSSSSADASVWGSWIQGKADGLGYTVANGPSSGTEGGAADEAADAPNSDDQFVDIDVAEGPDDADSPSSSSEAPSQLDNNINNDAPSTSPSSNAPEAQTPAPLSPGAPAPLSQSPSPQAPGAPAPTPQSQAQAPAPQTQAPAPNGPSLNPQSPVAEPALAPTPNNNKDVAQPPNAAAPTQAQAQAQTQAPQAQAPAAGAPIPQPQAHRGLFQF